MRIETPGGDYRVIRVLRKEISLCSYLAAGTKREESGQRFLLLEFRNPVLGRDMMLYFMQIRASDPDAADGQGKEGRNLFSDFVGCFVREKSVWAVFGYHEGISFHEAVKRAGSREERLLLFKRLLERLFLQKIPVYLRYEAANSANIVVDDASEVWVNYELYETDRLQEDLFLEMQKRLHESFCVLFETGMEEQAVCYAGKLAKGSFEDEMTLYREFQKLYVSISGKEESGTRDREVLLRLWRFVLRHMSTIVKCGYWIFVLALWGVFFWLCFQPEAAPEERSRICVIGTLEVGEPEQEAE